MIFWPTTKRRKKAAVSRFTDTHRISEDIADSAVTMRLGENHNRNDKKANGFWTGIWSQHSSQLSAIFSCSFSLVVCMIAICHSVAVSYPNWIGKWVFQALWCLHSSREAVALHSLLNAHIFQLIFTECVCLCVRVTIWGQMECS